MYVYYINNIYVYTVYTRVYIHIHINIAKYCKVLWDKEGVSDMLPL